MTFKPTQVDNTFATNKVATWVNDSGKSAIRGKVGYDAWSHRRYPTADEKGASGYFSNLTNSISVWITKLTADFSVSGETGQSRMLREFFPRSFNDVTVTITGRVASTQEYNRLALFIRESHWTALNNVNQGLTAEPTITFGLYDTYGNANETSGSRRPYKGRTVKGPHRPWTITGYVKQMAAGATAKEVAPEFSIAFIVATSQLTTDMGIWTDEAAPIPVLSNILSMVNSTQGKPGGFLQKADAGAQTVAATAENWAATAIQSLANLHL